MNLKSWLKGISLCTLISAACYLISRFALDTMYLHDQFFVLCLLVFVFFTFILFMQGYRASRLKRHFAFNSIIIFTVIFKLVLGLVLIVGYTRMLKPTNQLFVIPFFIVYVVFTIYETMVMSKLAQYTPGNNS